MFLVSLATAPVISKHGIDEVLRPFVEELQNLHKEKLEITTSSTSEKFEVALLAFLADNLAAHQVGGFKESMSFARRICRSCMTTTKKAQTNFKECNFELRTPEEHKRQCAQLEQSLLKSEISKNYGINRKSILENIPNFSVAQNLPHDIMHDLLEGVIPYELKLMLRYFVTECHFFTISQLNERLRNYEFGYTEIADRPSVLHDIKPHEGSLRQSAAQMWLLATVLPLIIGDLIPESEKHWCCFLLLLKICSIAAALSLNVNTVSYLSIIIEEHHELFATLYPARTIIPKMHYMVHYPSQIQKFGPLIHTWTMRYESKLRILKRASRHGNFKNICKTISKKHQHLLCYYLNNGKPFLQRDIEIGPIQSSVKVCAHIEFYEFISKTISVSIEEDLQHPKFIKFENMLLKSGAFVFIGADMLYPQFCKIVELIVFRSSFYLRLQKCQTEHFDEHYHSYSISLSQSFCFILINVLPLFPVLHIRKLCTVGKAKYVTLKQFVSI